MIFVAYKSWVNPLGKIPFFSIFLCQPLCKKLIYRLYNKVYICFGLKRLFVHLEHQQTLFYDILYWSCERKTSYDKITILLPKSWENPFRKIQFCSFMRYMSLIVWKRFFSLSRTSPDTILVHFKTKQSINGETEIFSNGLTHDFGQQM